MYLFPRVRAGVTNSCSRTFKTERVIKPVHEEKAPLHMHSFPYTSISSLTFQNYGDVIKAPLANHVIPQLLFAVFVSINIFLLMNLFVSVVTESFQYIRDHKEKQTHDQELASYLDTVFESILRFALALLMVQSNTTHC